MRWAFMNRLKATKMRLKVAAEAEEAEVKKTGIDLKLT